MRIPNSKKTELDKLIESMGLDKKEFEYSGENETHSIKYKHDYFHFDITKYSSDGYEVKMKTVDNSNLHSGKYNWGNLKSTFKTWVANIYIDAKHSREPIKEMSTEFPPLIKRFSKKFIEIYNQALTAEENDLSEICGLGYRKAFEFLIKDYLIKKNEKTEHEKIKDMQLYPCINHYVTNDEIKLLAHRILWLGNDHAHYTKKWKGKTLSDLKRLINLSIRWIEVHEELLKVMKEMPNGKK